VLVLFTRDLQANLFSQVKGLSPRERRIDLKERLSLGRNDLLFFTLGVIPFSLGMTFFSLVEIPPIAGWYGSIYRETPLHLG